MILRKSVEYIRYLQQLVSAQANRNRELEQALSVYREDDGSGNGEKNGLAALGLGLGLGMGMNGSGESHMHTPTSNDSPRAAASHDDMAGLMLHEDAGFGSMGGFHQHMNGAGGGGYQHGGGKSFNGFELASMPEDSEMDDHERPMTGMTMSGTSPSVGSGEDVDEREEEERGRRGRDGRVRIGGVKKYEEAEESSGESMERERKGMET